MQDFRAITSTLKYLEQFLVRVSFNLVLLFLLLRSIARYDRHVHPSAYRKILDRLLPFSVFPQTVSIPRLNIISSFKFKLFDLFTSSITSLVISRGCLLDDRFPVKITLLYIKLHIIFFKTFKVKPFHFQFYENYKNCLIK